MDDLVLAWQTDDRLLLEASLAVGLDVWHEQRTGPKMLRNLMLPTECDAGKVHGAPSKRRLLNSLPSLPRVEIVAT